MGRSTDVGSGRDSLGLIGQKLQLSTNSGSVKSFQVQNICLEIGLADETKDHKTITAYIRSEVSTCGNKLLFSFDTNIM
jgi:hypothetical protein